MATKKGISQFEDDKYYRVKLARPVKIGAHMVSPSSRLTLKGKIAKTLAEGDIADAVPVTD